MIIKGFIENSLIDWEGRISSMVFISGCNFSCPFCHNRALIREDVQTVEIPQEKIIAILREKRNWLDGVVITGGEPCMSSGLVDFIKELKKLGYPVKLDTNGSYPHILEQLLKTKLVDYVAMDVKAPLNDNYQKVTGSKIDIDKISQSINIIRSSAVDYEFRTTFVPAFLKKDDIVEIAALLQGSKKYYIQQFNPKETLDPALREIEPYSSKYLLETLHDCRKLIQNTSLRD
jgi:pyruvate formate lyase activating enzyme